MVKKLAEGEVQGRCMRCKKAVVMENPKTTKMKNGRPITKGTCPKCGTTVCRIG